MAAKSLKFDKSSASNAAVLVSAAASPRQAKAGKVVKAKRTVAAPAKVAAFELELRAPKWSSSRFEDAFWADGQGNPARGRQEKLNFEKLPERWRGYAKRWLCALDQVVEHGRKEADSFGTAALLFTGLGHFLVEVDKLGVDSLSALTEDQVHAIFLAYAATGVGRLTLSRYLTVLFRSHRWGASGLRVLDDGLSFDPSKDPFLQGKAKQAAETEKTPALPEEVAHKLLAMAVDWVENRREDVLFVVEMAKLSERAKSAKVAPGKKLKMLTVVQARKALEANPELSERLRTLPTRLGFEPRSLILEGHQHLQAGAEGVVADFMKIGLIAKKMQQLYQGCAYIVCAGFNGWRSSEVFSVEPDGLRQTPAGYLLGSKIIKTAANRGDAVARPVPEIVAKAVKGLAEVNAAMDGLYPRKNGRQGSGLFRSTTGGPIDIGSLMEDINYAWTFFQGSNIGLRSHQFRRFFAHFFLRRFKGKADAVRWHFRHVSKEMIWSYAKDAMNAKQLAESKKELAAEIVNGIVFGNDYASVAVAKELREAREMLRLGARVLTVEEAASFISAQIEKKFVDVHAMEWGYCLFQNGEKGAACEAKAGPVEARSEPATCGRCKFLCTGNESLAFWQQAALLHQEIAGHPKTTKIMRAESERFLATAEGVLSRHAQNKGGVK